jgi:hypothetical protein
MRLLILSRFSRVCAAPRLPPSTRCKFYVWLRTATRRDIEHEGAAVTGIGALRVIAHVLPGRRDKQARKIPPDERGAARLLRRDAQTAQVLAFRAVDVNATAAPARIPYQPIGIDHRAVDAAATPTGDQRGGRAERQAGRRIEVDAE